MSNYKKRNLKNNQICEMIIDYLKRNNNIVSKQGLVQSLISWASLSTIYRGINRLEQKGLIISCDVANDKYIAYVSDESNKSLNNLLSFHISDYSLSFFFYNLTYTLTIINLTLLQYKCFSLKYSQLLHLLI